MKTPILVVLGALCAAGMAMAGDAVELKTPKDKTSYAIGMDIGNSLKRNNMELDADILGKAIKDILTGASPLMTEQEAKVLMTALQKDLQTRQQEKMKGQGEKNKKDGEAFLAGNKNKEGVKSLASGLQYQVITRGKGKTPKATDTVSVQYKGMLIDGTEFDSSYKRGQPATFPVNGVIKGWTEALQLMQEGATWKLFIPSNLAYGEGGTPGGPIGPNAVLIFDVELLSIKAQ